MSAVQGSPQEMSDIYTTNYCVYACGVILVYDWVLCFGKEVEYIWRWRSRVGISTVVYAVCRYGMVVHNILAVIQVYPMSDQSCAANQWIQVVTEIMAMVAIWAFSGLRAYALSSRALWLTAVIFFWMLPPTVIFIVESCYEAPLNFPSPINCSSSSSLPSALSNMTITLVTRASQLVIELLAVVVTWWYSFQSYRIQKGTINLGNSLSSFLVYNGSTYFLFLASLYIFDIIVRTASVPESVSNVADFLELFYDPLASILVCRFMLSLRQFDASITSATEGTNTRIPDHTASTVLRFGAQTSESLPALIAPFAHPVHVDWSLSETDSAEVAEFEGGWECREMDAVTTGTETLPCSADLTSQGQNLKMEYS